MNNIIKNENNGFWFRVYKYIVHVYSNRFVVYSIITLQFAIVELLLFFLSDISPYTFALFRYGVLCSTFFYALACVASKSYIRRHNAFYYRYKAMSNFWIGLFFYIITLSVILMHIFLPEII